jgi:AraC-like DNA-binding protein
MLNRMIPNQMYIRDFLFKAIIFSMIFALFCLLLTNQVSDNEFMELDQFTQNQVKQTNDNTEFVLRNLKYYGLRIYDDPTIKKWLTSEQDSVQLQVAVGSTLNNYLASQPFIYDIYLINTRMGLVYDNLTWQSSIEDFHDQGILNKINNDQFKYLTYQDHKTTKNSYLSLIIPKTPNHQEMDGYLVILLNKQLLQKYLLLPDSPNRSHTFVVDSANQVILGNEQEDMLKALVPLTSNQNAGRIEWDFNQTSWSVRYMELKTEGWKLYHLTPLGVWKKSIYYLEWLIFSFSFVLLLSILLTTYWNSRRNFKPFSDLTVKIQTILGGQQNGMPQKSEVDLIDRGFVSLLDQVGRLDNSLKNNRGILKEEYLRQRILNGKLIEPVEKFLNDESSIGNKGYMHIAVMRIEGYAAFTDAYSFSSRKLFKYAMGNIAQEVLRNSELASEVVDFSTDHLVVLLPSYEPIAAGLLEALFIDIKKQIHKWLNLSIIAAVSEAYHVSDNLSEIYTRIYELSMLQFLYGEDRVYFEYHFKKYSLPNQQGQIDQELMNDLIQAVRVRNEQEMEKVLDTITHYMQELSYEECKHQFIFVIFSIIKTFKQLENLHEVKGIDHFFDRFRNLKEASDWLKNELILTIQNLRERTNGNRKEEIAAEIADFVAKNLHNPMLSIEDVADYVSLSKNYVRQIFKDSYDCSLSDFIVLRRIDRVRSLLKTTDWVIADIAEQSGFQSKSNFFTTFKKMTGMTPAQYRFEHLS